GKNSVPPLSPGDMLHAVLLLSLNSDNAGPVLAKVIRGPWAGSRLLGSFQGHENGLTLTFTSLVSKTRGTHRILAYAVDPGTDRTSLASSIDHHYLERFATLMAASFLEGFGEAVRESGRSSYSSVYGHGSSIPHYNPAEQFWIAAGKVGSHMAQHLGQNVHKKPTVTLESGIAIGVLILEGTGEDSEETEAGGKNGPY
nr:DotG/IcmE/VirB10 family protein [Desulfovibrio sp.]